MLTVILLSVLASAQLEQQSLAGKYYQGDGTGVNLYLTLDGNHQFSFSWIGCLGQYGKSEGRWSVNDRQLVLAPRVTTDMAEKLPLSYRVVRWGARTYLIPTGGLVQFCNYINAGTEPREQQHGMVFLKDGDWNRKTPGTPDLPQELRAFLLRKPVRTEIVSTDGARATINAGRSAGLLVGMVLTAQDSSVNQVRVTEVNEVSATVEPLYGEKVSLHTRFSTLLYDADLRH